MRGSINVHASLLPRYRGAAPIAWAIIRGETETGITTFQMDPGMDTGDMLLQEATPIGADETAGELGARLAQLGAGVLLRTLDQLDTITPTPQDHARGDRGAADQEGGRLAPPGRARARARQSRARLQSVARRGADDTGGAPADLARGGGAASEAPSRPARSSRPAPAQPPSRPASTSSCRILVQPESRKTMPWEDFLRGARLGPGARFWEIAA